MLSPADIRAQALRQYPAVLRAIVEGESVFPKEIRFGRPNPGADWETLQAEISALAQAKLGYEVEWEEINTRRWGRQRLPVRVWFQHEADYLRMIGKMEEVLRLRHNVALTREQCAELEGWLASVEAIFAALCADAKRDLRVQVSAAPLKLFLCGGAGGQFGNLRAQVSAAPLKRVHALPRGWRTPHLRAQVSAAPLKLFEKSRHNLRRRHLRAQVSAAPLKQIAAVAQQPAVEVSPRSSERGSVEAGRWSRRYLRAQVSAAPLKQHADARIVTLDVDLRAQVSAAPLKHRRRRRVCARRAQSPRSSERGSVEALVAVYLVTHEGLSPRSSERGSVEATPRLARERDKA